MSLDVAQVASSVDWKDRALASGKATSLFLTVLLLIGSCVAQADEKTARFLVLFSNTQKPSCDAWMAS